MQQACDDNLIIFNYLGLVEGSLEYLKFPLFKGLCHDILRYFDL